MTSDLLQLEAPPRWNRPRLARLGAWFLEKTGWTIVDDFPGISRCVVIVAPHSSNLDFFVGLAVSWVLDIRPSFVAKHTLFRWPLGATMRWLGGIPVNRKKSVGFVERTIALVTESDRIMLVIAPEGTRKDVARWKSGFYHIAVGSGVPIVPSYLDWNSRTVGFGPPFHTTGDVESDISSLRNFYARFSGRKE
jgi:1-acyl-sn-glycerol-3-phosphate acyltransferase